jgi:hypothetical protein
MWMFTIYGFFSCVCASRRSTVGPPVLEPDTSLMMIRCRVRSQLMALRERFGLTGYKIEESNQTDYRFRIVVDRHRFLALVHDVANDIDFSNFKQAVGDVHGPAGSYTHKCHSVWHTMQEPDSLYYFGPDKKTTPANKGKVSRRAKGSA